MVEGEAEANLFEGLSHSRPDLLARNAEVLHREGDVVADAGEHDLRLRVLHDQSDAAPLLFRRHAVDAQASPRFALVLASEDSGKSREERGLTRA